MKKLIAIAVLGAILFSVSPLAFAGEPEGQVFEPRPVPPYATHLAQDMYIFSPGDETREPLNLDIRG